MSREAVAIPSFDMAPLRESLDRTMEQIKELRKKIDSFLGVQEDDLLCKRDNVTVEAVYQSMRVAFFAGFRRSDAPPPSEERIEAAFREWMLR